VARSDILKILIVEDEGVAARRLERLTREFYGKNLESITCIETLKGSEEFLSQNSIDLLLLDLNLNGDDGFQLLKLAVSGSFQTIVVSANTDRALPAFEYGVLDFVPKPVESSRLWKAFERLAQSSDSRAHTKYLALRLYGSIELIPVGDILYLKGADDYVEIHCRNGSMHLHSKSLEALEKILPVRFVRIHKSYIVDKDNIVRIHVQGGGKYEVELTNREILPLSRTRYKESGLSLDCVN
jgi:two-component system response regulator LytT